MRRASGLVVASVLVGALGACAGGDPEPSLSPTQFVSATPAPTATESVDEIGAVMDLSDPEVGFELVDVPIDLEGDEADVYTTLALYEREYWRGLRDSEVSPFLHLVAAGELVTRLGGDAARNAEAGQWYAGIFLAEIGDIAVDGDAATAIVCDDYRNVEFMNAEGSHAADEVGAEPTIRLQIGLKRGDSPGKWLVTSTTGAGAC